MILSIRAILFTIFIFHECHTTPILGQNLDGMRGDIPKRLDSTKPTAPVFSALHLQTENHIHNQQQTEKEANHVDESSVELILLPNSNALLQNEDVQGRRIVVKRATDTSEITPQQTSQASQTSVPSQQPPQPSPPSVQAPQPSRVSTPSPQNASPTQVSNPSTSGQPSGITSVLANAANLGLDAAEQIAAVGDRISQRIKSRLNRVENGIDTMVDTKLNAYNDLFRSVSATGVMFPTTALRLAFAAIRVPLDVIG